MWVPGLADAGIVALFLKLPDGSAHVDPRNAWSKNNPTRSEAPNPAPAKLTTVVGGPDIGVTVTFAGGATPETGPVPTIKTVMRTSVTPSGDAILRVAFNQLTPLAPERRDVRVLGVSALELPHLVAVRVEH